MDKKGDAATATTSCPPPDERRVAPIRVVNLASLQDIKVISKEMPAIRQSRRKSMHQVRTNSDDQMEFIESRIESHKDTSGSNSPVASTSTSSIPVIRKSLPSSHSLNNSNFKRTIKLGNSSSGGGVVGGGGKGSITKEPRPNADLMKRVALLRVCAEYMLNELQIKNVAFGENHSLEMLKAQYMRNSRRKP